MFVEGDEASRARGRRGPHVRRASCDDRAGGGRWISWKEATMASLVLTISQVFIAFLTLYDLTKILVDPASFAFDLFKFAGASFFGTFIALTGLSRYQNR